MSDEPVKARIPLKRRLLYALVVYLIFVTLLAGVELVVRLTKPRVSSLDLFVTTPQQRAQVANEKQSTIFTGDPLLLWKLKPNLKEVVWDFTVVSTNPQGLRADYPVTAKPAGVFRVICLGDSVTFGYRVPAVWPDKPAEYDRSWQPYPILIEQQLRAANPDRKIEVIVMAVPGYTSHQGRAWLENKIDEWDPDLLTVSFGWNDVSFSDAPDRETLRTEWYAVTVRWVIDNSQAFAHVTKWLRSGKPTDRRGIKPVPRVSEIEYLNNMFGMVDLASQRNVKTVVIATPYRDRNTNPREAELINRYRSSLRAAAQQRQIPFLEVTELTEAAGGINEGWFGELIHPNHMGHRLLASELLKLFAAQNLTPGMKVPALTP